MTKHEEKIKELQKDLDLINKHFERIASVIEVFNALPVLSPIHSDAVRIFKKDNKQFFKLVRHVRYECQKDSLKHLLPKQLNEEISIAIELIKCILI